MTTSGPSETVPRPADERVLAQRLEQLRDGTWMQRTLAGALGALAGGPVAVERWRIDYCKIKPNRDINVALQVDAQWPVPGPDRRLISATLYGALATARRKFEDQAQVQLDPALRERPELAGFARLVGLVPDPPMIVRVFPADPGLPGLGPATDPRTIAALLSAPPEAPVSYDVLHYKPGRSCSLRYRLGDGADAGPARAYGKVYRDDRAARCRDLLEAAWHAATADGGTWQAARPLACRPEWRFCLQAAVPGRQFRHLFGELTHDRAGDAELDVVRGHLRSIAKALRSLHGAAAPAGPELTFPALLAAQEKNLAWLRRSQPRLAGEIAELRRHLADLEPRLPAAPLVFSHGDFAHGNVLVDDHGTVGVIDFDRAGRAEAAYDPAYFLTHMWSFGIRHPRRFPHVQRLCDDFRAAFLAEAPQVDPARLALYEALDFVAYVLRNFRKQSHQAGWMEWAEGQIGAASQRLAAAEGRPEPVP